MELKNKTILIVAQETWGDMFISKHHYANELAKLGNTVYYMNGPDQEHMLKPGEIRIKPTATKNLYLLEHRFVYPYIIKFQAPALHHALVRLHINNILKKIGRKVDLIWSFDLSNTMPLKCFPKHITKIFMPVDEPQSPVAIEAAKAADILFSVTSEILEKYHSYKVPKHFINHGVSEIFINDTINEENHQPLHIGLSGNMLRPEIDHQTLLEIIESNPAVVFDIWGTVNLVNSNLVGVQDASKKSLQFVEELDNHPNVILHGQLPPQQLAEALKKVDGFLICYNIKRDQSKGTNYHKVLEYVATGKVLIANNITTYNRYPGLIEMTTGREDNKELPQLFKKIISQITTYNAAEKQKERIEFAKKHTYANQISRIEQLIKATALQPGAIM